MTIDTTKDRRSKMADATAERAGELLHKARQTEDPVELLDIKADLAQLGESLDALLVITDFIAEVKPVNIKTATKKRDDAEKAISEKRDEIEKTIARLNDELDDTVAAYRQAAADHAVAVVDHNRLEAVRTGIPEQGYAEYSRPAIRAWARHAGIIK